MSEIIRNPIEELEAAIPQLKEKSNRAKLKELKPDVFNKRIDRLYERLLYIQGSYSTEDRMLLMRSIIEYCDTDTAHERWLVDETKYRLIREYIIKRAKARKDKRVDELVNVAKKRFEDANIEWTDTLLEGVYFSILGEYDHNGYVAAKKYAETAPLLKEKTA